MLHADFSVLHLGVPSVLMDIKQRRVSIEFFIALIFGVVFCSFNNDVRAQTEEFPRGQIVEKIVSRIDATQSYALFLPSNYTPERKWAILYCFDPGGRGAVPLAQFQEAAQKYNFILIGSNNSHNGQTEKPLNYIIETLFNDTHARFSIDEKRFYLAGFSGGARVACYIGTGLKNVVAGVIGCGGGFPSNLKPSAATNFAFFGTTGAEDFNNPELQELDRNLGELGVAHRLAVFDGGHDWCPPEVCTRAVGWLELQAMRAGRRERVDALIDEMFESAVEKARADEAARKSYETYLEYIALAEDFKNLRDVSVYEAKAAALKNSKEVRQAVKQEKELELKQLRREQQFDSLVASLRNLEDNFASPSELKVLLAEYRKASKAESASIERTLARRLLSSFFVQTFERGNAAMTQKNFNEAVMQYIIASDMQPENPRIFYALARANALNKNKRQALAALKSAAEKGFANIDALSTEDFNSIKNEADFKTIAETVKRNKEAKQPSANGS